LESLVRRARRARPPTYATHTRHERQLTFKIISDSLMGTVAMSSMLIGATLMCLGVVLMIAKNILG